MGFHNIYTYICLLSKYLEFFLFKLTIYFCFYSILSCLFLQWSQLCSIFFMKLYAFSVSNVYKLLLISIRFSVLEHCVSSLRLLHTHNINLCTYILNTIIFHEHYIIFYVFNLSIFILLQHVYTEYNCFVRLTKIRVIVNS